MPTFACIINHYIIVMKRLTYLMLFLLVALAAKAQQAKYVFYFIGDGMGLNQVNTTEMYLGEQQGRIGTYVVYGSVQKKQNIRRKTEK